MMHNRAGDHLTESRTDADRGADRANPTPSRIWIATSATVSLVSVYRTPRIGRTPKAIRSSGFRPHEPALRPDQAAIMVMTSCVVTTHADMNIIEARPWPFASISPRSGNIAAFAK